MSIPLQQQASARIISGGLRLDSEKILAQKNIFISIPIKIGNVDSKGGAELRGGRKRSQLEVIAAIEKNRCLQPIDFNNARFFQMVAKNLLDSCLRVFAV